MEKERSTGELFTEDPRFKVANREALIGVVLAVANFVWWYAFAYGLGGKPASEYRYILGFPDWFFYSCILGFIVFTVLVFIVIRSWFQEIPFGEEGDDE